MATLNLVLTTLVVFSCSKLTVDGKLGNPPSMRYQPSNEIETSKAGDHSQSHLSKRLKGFQPLKPNQLGWQPLKIHSDDQTKLKQKREPEKSKNKKDRIAKDFRKEPIREAVWVWNPLKQPKLTSNLAKVGKLKTELLHRAKETKLNFLSNERYSDRTTTHEELETTERKDNFFRGVLVLDPNGRSKFLLQTNPSDLNSKSPDISGDLNYLATSWKLNDLGVHGQNVYAGVGEDGLGYVGIGHTKPSLVSQPSSSVEDKSKLVKGGKFGSSDRQKKGGHVKTENRLLLSSNFKLVKGSKCRYEQDDKLLFDFTSIQ